jgi:hypothetical protein
MQLISESVTTPRLTGSMLFNTKFKIPKLEILQINSIALKIKLMSIGSACSTVLNFQLNECNF